MTDGHEVYVQTPDGALRQGEFISGLLEPRVVDIPQDSADPVEVEVRLHPLAVVLSQDCDLEGDHRALRDNSLSRECVEIRKSRPN